MNLDMRGRWYRWDKRATTNDYIQLDIAKFTRSVDLTQRCFGSWRWTWTSGRRESVTYRVEPGAGVRLMYTVGKQQDYDYLIRTATTAQPFGGVRSWWLCPKCGRRVRILYGGGALFVCRLCSGAYYETQQSKSWTVQVDNKIDWIRRKLKAKGGSVADSMPPLKPKGMHWKTYSRLALRYVELQRERNDAFRAEILRMAGGNWW